MEIKQHTAMSCCGSCVCDATMLWRRHSISLCLYADHNFFYCSLLNSNTCSAEHPSLSNEQQLGQSKTRLVPLTEPPALNPGPPPPSLHLPIITIPILITASDFIGALAAGKQRCSVLHVTIFPTNACAAPGQAAIRHSALLCRNLIMAVITSMVENIPTCHPPAACCLHFTGP